MTSVIGLTDTIINIQSEEKKLVGIAYAILMLYNAIAAVSKYLDSSNNTVQQKCE